MFLKGNKTKPNKSGSSTLQSPDEDQKVRIFTKEHWGNMTQAMIRFVESVICFVENMKSSSNYISTRSTEGIWLTQMLNPIREIERMLRKFGYPCEGMYWTPVSPNMLSSNKK